MINYGCKKYSTPVMEILREISAAVLLLGDNLKQNGQLLFQRSTEDILAKYIYRCFNLFQVTNN